MGAWNRFWHVFAITPARLRVLRFGLFDLLAFDLRLKMFEHAPRSGAGDFNVPQFRVLVFLPLPTAEIVGVAWLVARCGMLAEAYRRRGRAEEAGAHARCRTHAASAGADAFVRGLRHAPRDSRGHKGKRRAERYQ